MATHSSWRIPWTEEPGRLRRATESAITEATWHAPKQEKTRGSLSFQRLLCKVTSSQAGQLQGDHFIEYHDLTFCCCFSAAQSCPTCCNPEDCSTPSFPVLHYLPEFAQTHVHRVSDAIQSFPTSESSVSWLFTSDGQNTGASASASVFQWIFRVDFP